MSNIAIVLVQLGKIPHHLELNLRYLAAHFSNHPIFLIADTRIPSRILDSKIRIVMTSELHFEWPTDFEIKDKRKKFRDNFWFTTKARLMLLPVFMNQFDIEKLIHFESDVWVHPEFPFEYFDTIKQHLAFPRVDASRGVASVLYINGESGGKTLSSACMEYPRQTDMEILGKLLESHEKVFQLPSLDGLSDFPSKSPYIFDGAVIGMYLFGQDPRNNFGLIKRFKKSNTKIESKVETFELKNNLLFAKRGAISKSVVTLHLHSKETSMFALNWQEVLERQLKLERWAMNYSFRVSAAVFAIKEQLIRIFWKIIDF